MQKHNFILVLIGACGLISAAFAQPLDLDYRVSGVDSLRPSLVFNDGNDTFIQGDESLRVIGLPYERQGPYLVVRGIKERIVLEGKGMRRVSVVYTGSAVTASMLTQSNDSKPATCDQTEMESMRIDMIYGPSNIEPGPLLKKTLKAALPSIKSGTASKLFVAMDPDGLAPGRINALRDFMLKNNVPHSKFSISLTDDPTLQNYMLIGRSVSCTKPTTNPSSPTVYPTPLTGSAMRGTTSYSPPTNGKKYSAGDIDTILQLLHEGRISEETASTMIAGVNLAQKGTTLERLFAQSQQAGGSNVAPAGKSPSSDSEMVLQHKPGAEIFGPKPKGEAPQRPIAGQFIVENTAERSYARGEVFDVQDFAGKPSPKTMVRLSRVVGDKYPSLFVVKGDGSPEGKTASTSAAKALLRLGVENVRFDRGANKGQIEIIEEGGKV